MSNHDAKLHAVLHRDPAQEGAFVFGVVTTGIYCRPTCPARKPKPENIRFYDGPEQARAAGFRACKRCKPDDAAPAHPQAAAVRRVAEAIAAHVADGAEGPPKLADLAARAGLSPFHLQRTFAALMGVSPRAYADALRLKALKSGLRQGQGVADAAYGAGFGSSSRVYERAAAQLGMTPATYAKGGAGATLAWATAPCFLGLLFVAGTARGIAALYFGDGEKTLLAELAREFPAATLVRDDGGLKPWLAAIVKHLDKGASAPSLPLDIRATAFQWRVWQELQRIPPGETRSYGEIAAIIGAPRAHRAVGHACATNPVSLLVPCHRALRADGSLGGYRWGLKRKEKLLRREGAK
jgi:AraC family transcriptional regulator of adaptative response/methylated-DNA-[protein]-cysteine methyltransferase